MADFDNTRALADVAQSGDVARMAIVLDVDETVLDNSPKQLEQDRLVAEREGLSLQTLEGDMTDLSVLSDASFGLIFHPCSNSFSREILPVWKECFRVLRRDGILLVGFTNPVRYVFDDERQENGSLEVRHALPYSDETHLTPEELERIVVGPGQPLEFSHSLEEQIGGQLAAGFVLTDLFEDRYEDRSVDPISAYLPTFIATRAKKLADRSGEDSL